MPLCLIPVTKRFVRLSMVGCRSSPRTATRAEPGCVIYDLNGSVTNSNRVVFVEQWKSRDDLEAHFTRPHMKVFRDATASLVESRTVEVIHPERIETL